MGGKKYRWGVILDAGSSGTRLHIYRWKDAEKAIKSASPEELRSLPKLRTDKKWTKKIRPGISSFGDDPSQVGRAHLQSLIDHALDIIPESKVHDTPIFLMATAGMRLLPQAQQRALTREVCSYLQANTKFSLPDCDLHIQVIKGETEGLYGWIASNYLLGGFDRPEDHAHGKGHHTYGFLDMGGASAQIAFAPNATEAEKHADDLKLLRLRTLDGKPAEYKVFTTTWLGFGVNQARESYIKHLEDQYPSSAVEFPDPCLPKGLRTSLDGEPISRIQPKKATLIGTGAFKECLRQTHPLLGKDKPCLDDPCLLNGQHVPAIDFDVNHFVGVSEFFHTTHGVFGGHADKAYDFATYQKRVEEFCAKDWSYIESHIKNKSKKDSVKNAQEACFKASWLINVLHEGIGVPRIGMEHVPTANVSKGALEHAKNKGFIDPFQAVDKIDGIEVSWTLGKMVLYAAGQIPPRSYDDRFPVGFGSNLPKATAGAIPDDFQFAGSSWKNSGLSGTDDDDDWDLDTEDLLERARTRSTVGFFAFVLILFLGIYWFRKRERRMRVYGRVASLVRRSRRSGGSGALQRKSGSGSHRGLPGLLASKLFGRSGGGYERVLEEGAADQFELGDVDSDEDNSSEGSLSSASRLGRSSGLATPAQQAAGLDRSISSSSAGPLDRAGLVVRTESREHLFLTAPNLQMLGAGKRSRVGSPTRMKSPLASPLQDD